QLANITPGIDTITFSPDIAGIPLRLTLGELQVTDDVTIEGLGARMTIIDAGGSSRVFDVARSGSDLTLKGVTVTGGKTTADDDDGGGIRMKWAGTLTVIESSISGNTTAGFGSQGGGIFAYAGKVTILNSLISGNS